MATLVEIAAQIVSSHASTSSLTTEELLQEIQKVYSALQNLEAGSEATVPAAEEAKPNLTVKDAFKKNEVICMICGKGGMKTLTRHLKHVHDIKPGEYKKEFGIPSKQSLSARSYSESRRQMALDRGLADNLAKARAVRMANVNAKKAAPAKAAPAKAAPAKAAPAKAAKVKSK